MSYSRLAFFVLALLHGCASGPLTGGNPELVIDASVGTESVKGKAHPILSADFSNPGPVSVALSKTFGYSAYVIVRIESSAGEEIDYPVEADLFDHVPSFECLKPGQTSSLVVDLLAWPLYVSGRPNGEELYAFDLPPGDYRVRVEYHDHGVGRCRSRCRHLGGAVFSEWVRFAVSK